MQAIVYEGINLWALFLSINGDAETCSTVSEAMFSAMDQTTVDSGPWFLTHGTGVSTFAALAEIYYDDHTGIRSVPPKAAQSILAAKYASKGDVEKLVATQVYDDVNKVMGPQSRAQINPTSKTATHLTTASTLHLVSSLVDIPNTILDFQQFYQYFNSIKRQANLAINAITKIGTRLTSDFWKLCVGDMGTALRDVKSLYPHHTLAVCIFQVESSDSIEKVNHIQSAVILARFDVGSARDIRVLYKRNVNEGYLSQEPALVAMMNKILRVCVSLFFI
jgi:hypothetical protein